jgi:uncharacterized membrane protein YccC
MEPNRSWTGRVRGAVAREVRQLSTVNATDRPWQLPVAAAAASGLPLLIAAWFDALPAGLAASLGGLVFLYLPNSGLSHRMAWLMACAFGMSASYAFGLLGHLFPPAAAAMLALIAVLVTMICRFYAVPPPGSLFFVMAAAIGAYTPMAPEHIPLQVGLLTMGAVLACLVAFIYSLWVPGRRGQPPPPGSSFDYVVLDSVVIGAFVALSLGLAQLLQLQRPYWVPVSCLAVIQGASLRAVWNRQLQRIAGTGLGLLVFWGVAAVPLDAWGVAIAVILLTLVVESLVVRHYGLAVVFITPLAILLAEAARLGAVPPQEIMRARLVDTVLGCMVGLAGGACLHSPRFRAAVGKPLRWLVARQGGRG